MPDYAEKRIREVEQRIYAKIRQRIKDLGITRNEVCSISGASYGSLTNIIYGKAKNPGIDTLIRICWALGCGEGWMFDE